MIFRAKFIPSSNFTDQNTRWINNLILITILIFRNTNVFFRTHSASWVTCILCETFFSNVLTIHRTCVRLWCLLYRKHVIAKSFYCGNTLPSHWVARKRVHDRPFPCSLASVTLADRNSFFYYWSDSPSIPPPPPPERVCWPVHRLIIEKFHFTSDVSSNIYQSQMDFNILILASIQAKFLMKYFSIKIKSICQ